MKTLLLIWSLGLGHCLASQPPFATNGVSRLIIGDYDLAADPGAPFRLLETNGLAPYAPPMFAP